MSRIVVFFLNLIFSMKMNIFIKYLQEWFYLTEKIKYFQDLDVCFSFETNSLIHAYISDIFKRVEGSHCLVHVQHQLFQFGGAFLAILSIYRRQNGGGGGSNCNFFFQICT